MFKVDYHADDYGASPHNARRLLELANTGKLQSMSFLPNMGCYEECRDYLHKKWDSLEHKPLISIHINLIDGYSLSGCKNPILVNEDGIIDCKWENLFRYSFTPGKERTALKKDIRKEIKEQIKRVYKDLPEGCALRVDSHLHTHMIPIVFDSMIGALKDLSLLEKTEYIRISDEPIWPFLTTPGVAFTYPAVNIIKNRILHLLGERARWRVKRLGIEGGMLMGLYMSGCMDKKRLDLVMPKMRKFAQRKDRYLEIMTHPGIVLRSEDRPEYCKSDLLAFFSENRNIEYDMILNREDL
ncbi:MAG: ChbG/HpnK family deacetylase [Lachnospiraceae bacterium]|nr:ChbG/HpnK family deacetylase [Lachnospiraceae bacterium]